MLGAQLPRQMLQQWADSSGLFMLGTQEAPLEAVPLSLVIPGSLGWESLTSGLDLIPHSFFSSTFFSCCRMQISRRCFEGRGPNRDRGTVTSYSHLTSEVSAICSLEERGKERKGKRTIGLTLYPSHARYPQQCLMVDGYLGFLQVPLI